MKSEQHNGYSNEKEHIVNDIYELKQQIILIENKLRELRIFYITNKDKYDYDYKLAKTFLDNLQNFIEKEIINIYNVRMYGGCGASVIFNSDGYDNCKHAIESCLITSQKVNKDGYIDGVWNNDKLCTDSFFILICCHLEEVLILGMFIKEKKIKCYENLMKLYPEKPDIKTIMDLYPEKPEKPEIKNKQYSMSASVIFLIMIVFYVMTVATVILLVNYNQNLNHNYNTAVLYHPVQCAQIPLKTTRFIDNHNKFKDIMLV